MAVFQFRIRHGAGESSLHPSAPVGPWLELEADTFDDARRDLAELAAATHVTYEVRPLTSEDGDR